MTDQSPLRSMIGRSKEMVEALNRANRTALLRHARLGEPVSTWRDGKVVWLSPAEVFALYGLDEFGREIPTAPVTAPHTNGNS